MKKLIFAMAVVAAGVAAAGVSFSYQGALKTKTGENLPANERNKTIEFRLYETPTGEGALWGRALAVHLDEQGLFNVELSDTAGSGLDGVKTNDLAVVLSDYPGNGRGLYIGLTVLNSVGEIRPRQRLLNVPTAAFAADVSTAKGDFSVMGTATFEGKIIANKGLTVESAGLSITGGGGIIPRGGIIMWSGSSIPEGWVLCDGTPCGDVTPPDLSGRFIVGCDPSNADYNKIGKTGGAASVTLTSGQTPLREHSHNYWGDEFQKLKLDNFVTDGEKAFDFGSSPDSGDQVRYTYRYETSKTGDNTVQAHENRPPYYVLAFIMKL